jgi:protein TonB
MLASGMLAFAFAALGIDQDGAAETSAAITPPLLASGPFFLDDGDYPDAARKLTQEVVTRFAVHVSAKGKVLGCRIIESSGSPSLDEETCKVFSRQKFKAARDADGKAVDGEYVRNMKWSPPQH